MALGCGLLLLSRALDGSFRTSKKGSGSWGCQLLESFRNAPGRSGDDDLVLSRSADSATAESFRSLRDFVVSARERCGYKTFLFTSAVGSEGKSFCAINCAVSFAQLGLKTLLIDADLRLPSIGGIFFDGTPVEGLTDVLTYRTDLDDVARPTSIDKLSVLCAGNQLNRPAELLAGEGFGRLIKNATTKFDRVVVNSAPIQAVATL